MRNERRITQLVVAGTAVSLMAMSGCSNSLLQSTGDSVVKSQSDSAAYAGPDVQGSWSYQGEALAGNGNASFSGDSGAASAASVWAPRAFIMTPTQSTTYVADTWNNRIRMIDSKGTITTIAGDGGACTASPISSCGDGGPALKAQLNRPSGLALQGNKLYVADTSSNRVRMIDLNTGMISPVAGNGDMGYNGDGGAATSAELAAPLDVAVDDDGNVFIADTDNNRIRRVDPSGVITTIAGTGSQCESGTTCGVGGPAISAQLATPSGVTVLPENHQILIADTNSHTIRSIDANGTFGTVIGTGQPGTSHDGSAGSETMLDHPRRVSLATTGQLIVSDTGNQRILVAAADTHQVWQVLSTQLTLDEPWSVSADRQAITVADAGLNRLLTLKNPTGPTLTWTKCGPDAYPHSGPSSQFPEQPAALTDILTMLPGATSADVQAWGAPGGDSPPSLQAGALAMPGGVGGYATTHARITDLDYAVVVGCQGSVTTERGSGGDAVLAGSGGGGATLFATLSGYQQGIPIGNVLAVGGGGGGASGASCGPTAICDYGMQSAAGGAGGPGDGLPGQQSAAGRAPGLSTGGSGTGSGGQAADGAVAPVEGNPTPAGAYGFGGPGGSDYGGVVQGGWGPQWRCNAGMKPGCAQPGAGTGGAGEQSDFASGGGGGGGAGGGGGGYQSTGLAPDKRRQGFAGGAGGGSWAMCVQANPSGTVAIPPPPGGKAALVVRPGSTPVDCTPGQVTPQPSKSAKRSKH